MISSTYLKKSKNQVNQQKPPMTKGVTDEMIDNALAHFIDATRNQ